MTHNVPYINGDLMATVLGISIFSLPHFHVTSKMSLDWAGVTKICAVANGHQ